MLSVVSSGLVLPTVVLVCLGTLEGAREARPFAPPATAGMPAQAAAMPLEELMKLSAEAATADVADLRAGELAARCAEQMRRARAYRSWLVKRDFSMEHLKAADFAYVEWRFELAEPDRLHVRQTIREQPPLGELREERRQAGSEHFLYAGSWTRADPQLAADFSEMDRFLRIRKFEEIVGRGKPALVGAVRLGERRIALLAFEGARLEAYAILTEFEAIKCLARLWVDAETGLLVKGELVYRGTGAGGRRVHKVFDQVFSDYNEPLVMEAPPAPR